jgi:uncharacterized membrane protein
MQNMHPLVIHFPIALLSVGLLCDLLARVSRRDSLRNCGWWCQAFGMAGIVGAALTGLIAESTVAHSDASHNIMQTHKTLELVAVGIFALLFIWRGIGRSRLPERLFPSAVYLVLAASAVGLMFYGAHLGGRLVYEFGVGGSAAVQSTDESDSHNHSHGVSHGVRGETPVGHDAGTHRSAEGSPGSDADSLVSGPEKGHEHKDGKAHKH